MRTPHNKKDATTDGQKVLLFPQHTSTEKWTTRQQIEQEAHLLLTNRATHLCNVQWRVCPLKTPLPARVTTPNLVVLGQTVGGK